MLLAAVDTGNTILFTISYSTGLFKEETIRRFADYYMNIISSILLGTDRKIAEIEIMSEEQRNNLFNKINGKNGERFSNGIEIVHEPEESLEVEFDF